METIHRTQSLKGAACLLKVRLLAKFRLKRCVWLVNYILMYEALPTHKSLSKQLKPMRKSFAKKITEKKKNNNPVKMTLRIVFRNPLSWCRYGYIMHYCVQLASRHYIEVFNQMKGFNIIICTYNHTELYM